MAKGPRSQQVGYGMEVILDLYECDPKTIRSKKRLAQYVTRLCKILRMEKYGRTLLPHFGYKEAHTAGYSMLQFIETSSITGHFSELWNSAYINIFSCRAFEARRAVAFTVKFFQAKQFKNRVLVRN